MLYSARARPLVHIFLRYYLIKYETNANTRAPFEGLNKEEKETK